MKNQPAAYNMDMAEKMYLHYDEQLQRKEISLNHRRFLHEQQRYWLRMFVNAHSAIPLERLINHC